MRSLESLNQAVGVLHSWGSAMSAGEDGEEVDIDARIEVPHLHFLLPCMF